MYHEKIEIVKTWNHVTTRALETRGKKKEGFNYPDGIHQNIVIKKLRGIHFGAQIIAVLARKERIYIAYLAASPYAGQRITVHSLVAILHFCFTWHTFIKQIKEKITF